MVNEEEVESIAEVRVSSLHLFVAHVVEHTSDVEVIQHHLVVLSD